jgi:hypothetical protein
MINFLEQLAAEWYEFRGYFVRRNIRVGLRPRGGYESELDVVAFDPDKGHLVHIEASSLCLRIRPAAWPENCFLLGAIQTNSGTRR